MNNSDNKIFAFWGDDFPNNSSVELRKISAMGYQLFAANVEAIGLAKQAGMEFTILDDWISPKEIAAKINEAEFCGNNWYLPIKEELTSEGICWPEIDSHAFDWF